MQCSDHTCIMYTTYGGSILVCPHAPAPWYTPRTKCLCTTWCTLNLAHTEILYIHAVGTFRFLTVAAAAQLPPSPATAASTGK
jgi:hypothetical protein